MKNNRIVRWCIVLFLLLALPGLTATLAQGINAPEAPATWNIYESEPNNTLQTADVIQLNDLLGAQLGFDPDEVYDECETDWFRFNMPHDGFVLIDVDGFDGLSPGSYNYVYLYSENQTVINGWEVGGDSDPDKKIFGFQKLNSGSYYLKVDGFDDCRPYEIALSTPLLISAAAANLGTGTVAGINFQSGDILAFSGLNNGEERWRMFFDASDVGVKTLVNVATAEGLTDEIRFTVGSNTAISGVGVATPWDIIIFKPERFPWGEGGYGDDTYGAFRMGFDGSEHQLTTSGEKLDAIAGGKYCDFLSTTGTAVVPNYSGTNIRFKDEDLGCWWLPSPEWLRAFVGADIQGLAVEDVFAAAYNDAESTMYLTILGSGRVAGHKLTQKDIFAIDYSDSNWGGYVWRGPVHGWNYKIDAFEFGGW